MNNQSKGKLTKKIFSIKGMHCSSCAINIDGELEDTDGVIESNTSYAKQQTEVKFNEEKIADADIIGIIKKLGYTAVSIT
ncbi:MAG: heavy-metal-associated domain-containing protein [Candidatus Levybacteria bacterium]|nr:heavy-metal-associated domain-containing protein [Candidatus Levybacteria bacterium]